MELARAEKDGGADQAPSLRPQYDRMGSMRPKNGKEIEKKVGRKNQGENEEKTAEH